MKWSEGTKLHLSGCWAIDATLGVSTDYLNFGKNIYGMNIEDALGKMISKLSQRKRDSLAQILCAMLQEDKSPIRGGMLKVQCNTVKKK